MTDLEIAQSNLAGHTICLCKDGNCLFSEKRGIAPMMGFIAENVDLHGYSAADLVVGKAVAMLFVKSGVPHVFAKLLSQAGKKVLEEHGVNYRFETLTDKIVNRDGTDICPMEKTVSDTEDVDEAYLLLKNKLAVLQGKK